MVEKRANFDKRYEDKINAIIDYQHELKNAKEHLDYEKEQLLELMKSNATYEYYGENGIAKIIAFDRENLVKDEVLATIDDVNAGRVKKIDVDELMKESKVCFVMVRSKE